MGGSNETTIGKLRLHVNDGDRAVHIHDDCAGIKFEMDTPSFKQELEDTLESLKTEQGAMLINGKTGTSLCVLNSAGKIAVSLVDTTSVKGKLQDFLKGI